MMTMGDVNKYGMYPARFNEMKLQQLQEGLCTALEYAEHELKIAHNDIHHDHGFNLLLGVL